MPSLKLLIFDANVVFYLYEIGLWQALLERCEIHLSRIVAEVEVRYYRGKEWDEVIDLSADINSGRIRVFDVDVSEVKKFCGQFDRVYLEKPDDGEAESLTFMLCQPDDSFISSADAIVFRVLGNLNQADRGVSLEEVLTKIGLTRRNLPHQYTRKYREKFTSIGAQERIRGQGFRGP
jgi:hypothetical protein